jgi:hypothetical protein
MNIQRHKRRLLSARHLSSQGTCELYLSRHFFVTRLLILVVYIIALCSSINTTTFCFLHVCSDLDPTDVFYMAHNLPLLEAPSVKKPDSSIGLNCHPILLNSIDTFPVHLGRSPHSAPDAHAIYREANKPENMDFLSREISRAYWKKVQGLGATVNYRWQVHHTVQAMPDHLMTLGVPSSTSHAVICGKRSLFGRFAHRKTSRSSHC